LCSSKGESFSNNIFRKKHKHFDKKIYKLYNTTSYTDNMNVNLRKDRQYSTQMITTTHVTARSLTRRAEGLGHKFFLSRLFDDMHTRGIKTIKNSRRH
jgi:hypothetical protein